EILDFARPIRLSYHHNGVPGSKDNRLRIPPVRNKTHVHILGRNCIEYGRELVQFLTRVANPISSRQQPRAEVKDTLPNIRRQTQQDSSNEQTHILGISLQSVPNARSPDIPVVASKDLISAVTR